MNILKISQFIIFAFIITFLSCSKEDADIDVEVCTVCIATLNGNSSHPVDYCGSVAEVVDFEEDFYTSSQLNGATAECERE